MTLGCIAFTTADITISPNFDWFGIFLISAALCADAAIGQFVGLIETNIEIKYIFLYSVGHFMIDEILD